MPLLIVVAVVLASCGSDELGTLSAEGRAEPTPPAERDHGDTSDPPEAEAGEEPEDEAADEVDAAIEDGLRIVATVAPIADIVGRVAGDPAEVTSLVPPGVDAHTYEPRPSDVARMQAADAFVGVGHDLNPAAVRLAEAHLPHGAPIVLLGEDALDAADLLGDDHSHDHDHSHSHSHDQNPHVWTSVRRASQMAGYVAAVLSELDPEGAETYGRNAEAYVDRLATLDGAISAATATIPEEHRVMVVYHDAWHYFAADYGLRMVAAVQPSDMAEPSASDVRSIIEQVQAEGVPAIFGSEVFSSRIAEAIAAETDATYVGELADDVLPGDPGDPAHSYVGLMARNALLIVESLGGDGSALEDMAAGR